MNPQFDLVMSLLNVPKYAPHAWPHLTQSSRAPTVLQVEILSYLRLLFSVTEVKF
jgi:hypothetical protein